MKRGMYYQGNKIVHLAILILLLLFVSCNKYKDFDVKEIESIRYNTQNISQSTIGAHNYWAIYQMANDSIKNWRDNQLGLWKYYDNTVNFQIDSVFCVNEETDKIVFSILRRQVGNESVADGIWYFYGVKIYGQWYFFDGAAMILPRENYQQDIHTPLSFDKLKQIATWHIYRHYLKKNQYGEWVINEQFFSDLTSGAWCSNCNAQEQWNEAYLRHVQANWQKARK